MEIATIGAILRKRIKEEGYTQEEFAEIADVRLSTLKKQMRGDIAYRVDDLIKYAELLDCSYDYLLGYSKSAEREYHEVTEQTRLSIQAIDRLTDWAKEYDTDILRKHQIKVLNEIIVSEDFLSALMLYCAMNRALELGMKEFESFVLNGMGKENISESTNEFMHENWRTVYLVNLMTSIEKIKNKCKDELYDAIREDLNNLLVLGK